MQVELVLAQFRRAKVRADVPDSEMVDDIFALYNTSDDSSVDKDRLRRLAEKLQLIGISDLTQESIALNEMVSASGGDPEQSIEKMAGLLNKIKDFVQKENLETDTPARENSAPESCSGQVSNEKNHKAPIIPDDFRCPISLELMRDPVIVSTGQVLLQWAFLMIVNNLNDMVFAVVGHSLPKKHRYEHETRI